MKICSIPITIALVLNAIAIFHCQEKPTEPEYTNPLDTQNPFTNGDPFQFTATIGNGGVVLNWNKVDISTIAGYNIYRSETSYSNFRKIGDVNNATTTYTDLTVENGHSYWYKVTARDTQGRESSQTSVVSVRINTEPVIVINGGDEYTARRQVNLTILAAMAVKMWVSNMIDFTDGQWESYASSKDWQLLTGPELKIVYLKIQYNSGEVSTTSADSIGVTAMNPSLYIEEDAAYTSSRNVLVRLNATGENLRAKLSEDSTFAEQSWQAYQDTLNFELTTGSGRKAVFAKFKNDFEIESGVVRDDILLDTIPPDAQFFIDPVSGVTNETIFYFDASSSNDNLTISENLFFRWDWEADGAFDVDWGAHANQSHEYSIGGGNTSVTLEVRDEVGWISSITQNIFVNTRPVADFSWQRDQENVINIVFDASGSSDYEDGANLQYRWDWESDGLWDTNYSRTKTFVHKYATRGTKRINLEVKDTGGLTKSAESQILVIYGTDDTDTVTDINGNTYWTVKIGDQWWMAENLKVTYYRNGDTIPKFADRNTWSNLTSGAYSDYYSDYYNDTTYVFVYGMLYNWYAVIDNRNIAPAGWHVPSDAEWQILADYLGGNVLAGGKLKEKGTMHWKTPNAGATNEYGFSAVPGGGCYYAGDCADRGDRAQFWSITELDRNRARNWHLYYRYSGFCRYFYDKRCGFSVRCVRD